MNERRIADLMLEDDDVLFVASFDIGEPIPLMLVIVKNNPVDDGFWPFRFSEYVCAEISFGEFYNAMNRQGFFGPILNPKPRKLYDRGNI